MTLLLALLLQADLRACGGCQVHPHPDPACGRCVACAVVIASCDDRLCRPCASARKACLRCAKGLPSLEAVIGAATAPDKQPRPDATYVVIQAEGAGNRGAYASRREWPPVSGRGLAWSRRIGSAPGIRWGRRNMTWS